MIIPISLLFFLSGFAALVYELLWFRHLGFIFGNTVYAATAVLTAYMLGLAIGARLLGKHVQRNTRPIRLFGILEGSIGVYALLIPLLFLALNQIYRGLYQNVSDSFPLLTGIRFLLSIAIMLIPTILMGGTLPVLTHALARRDEGFSARLGWLYGVNTLGAMTGLVVAGFVMLPNLGLRATNLVAVAVNIGIGVVAVLVGQRVAAVSIPDQVPASKVRVRLGADARCALWLAALAGMIGLALEVVWFRTLVLVFGSTTYSFTVMLAVFLFGIAAGSILFGWLADRTPDRIALLAGCFILVGASTVYAMHRFIDAPEFLLQFLLDRSFNWTNLIHAKILITLSMLLLPTLSLGFLFNVAARIVRASDESSGDTVGRVYWYNTMGAVVGSLGGGLVLLPWLGMQRSILTLSIIALLAGLALCLLRRPVRRHRLALAVLPAAVAISVWVRPPYWDPLFLSSGAFFFPDSFIVDGQVAFWEKISKQHLRFYHEGVVSTVSVTETLDRNLYFSSGGKVEADTTNPSMVLQRMQGHLPMLFHPNPRRVVNIGLGAGVTFGSLSCYPTDHLEVVEIEPGVKQVATVWADYNHNVMGNPDTKVTIGDGRNYLFCTPLRFDVITADPFEPVHHGAGHLYTVEHFRQARERLADGGIMGQFLPLYEMSKEDFFIIMRSFAEVFPASFLFYTGTDTVMLGFREETALDFGLVKRKFDEIPAVRDSLAEVGFTEAEALLGMFVADLSLLLEEETSHTLNTDNHPVIEFSTPKSTLKYTAQSNAEVLLDHFTPIPEVLLADLTQEQAQAVRNDHRALELTLEASLLRSQSRSGEAFAKLKEAYALAPGNPVIQHDAVQTLLKSAAYMTAQGHVDQAVLQYQLALTYDAHTFWAIYNLFHILVTSGQDEQAAALLALGHEEFPEAALLWALHGKFEGTQGRWNEARTHFERALEYTDWVPDIWRQYAVCLEQLGEGVQAGDALREAEALESNPVMARALRAQ